MGIQTFRSINSGKPFRNTANEYLEKGWQPIPLPPKEKFPPPTGFTGRNAESVTAQQITDWVADPNFPQDSNIGIHLDSVTILDDQSGEDIEYDVIGIDVDITDDKYDKKGNLLKHGKSGGDTIAKMEQDLGKLPETFMSTAHGPGARAGIRFYLVPSGLKWPGKIGDSVDCIQKAHRYAVVSPSWHPTAGQYCWYGTTDNANLAGEPCDIPDVAALPMLPAEWVGHLTSGIKDTAGPVDQDSTVDEIMKWFKRTTAKGDMCRYMDKQVGKARDAFHHDIHSALRDMQRAIVAGGIEGHPGATKALNRLKKSARRANRERVATNAEGGLDDGQGGKMNLAVRSDDEFEREWKRSLWGAIRLVKGEVDEGVKAPQKQCACITVDMEELKGKFKVNNDIDSIDLSDFHYTDDGNAELFQRLYGDVARFAPEINQWYVLVNGKWEKDNIIPQRMFHAVRDMWEKQAKALYAWAIEQPEEEQKGAMAKFRECKKHADVCGSHRAAPNCLSSLIRYEGVATSVLDFDSDPHLLGCVNGVLELNADGSVTLRDYDPQELITKSTAVPYTPWETIMEQWEAGEGEHVRGVELLQDYFEKFIPDEEMRLFIQRIFGAMLFGRNDAKKMFFFNGPSNTGKSTLVNLLTSAMGEYGGNGSKAIFTAQEDKNPSLIAVLGKRLVNMPEFGSSTVVNSDLLKTVGSGDKSTARDLYARSDSIISFMPSMTFICPANSAPSLDKADDATAGRTCCVPFEQQIDSGDQVEGRAAEMEAMCQEVLFSWAVEGWREACEKGFADEETWPEAVRQKTHEFRAQLTPTGFFEEDMLELTGDDNDFIPKEFLYKVYTDWSREAMEKQPMPKQEFIGRMKETLTEKRASFGKHEGKQLKMLGYVGVRFKKMHEVQENERVIKAKLEIARAQAGGARTANFKSKSS